MLYASAKMMSHTGEAFDPFCLKVLVVWAWFMYKNLIQVL